jgi:regulation of enolase protein 1 (concanavalin A-like superfamily)
MGVAEGVNRPIYGDWADPIDPDGDCRFDLDRARGLLKIAVPGTAHILSAELGRMNAPRLLRPVRGDFVASAKVAGVFAPTGRSTTKEYPPYHGAGLLLWQDERNYVRLELAADVHHGRPRPYANFELRRGDALAISRGVEIKDGSARLLLERRGGVVRAAFGPDGIHWTRFEPIAPEFDGKLAVGVVVINSSTKPLVAELEGFAITASSPADDGREGTVRPPTPEPRPTTWAPDQGEASSRLDRTRGPIPGGELP